MSDADSRAEQNAIARAAWGAGDYHRFATETIWEIGPVLVEAAGIGAGQRVLDVAAGTGNVAIRAAEAGADVVASDLTPEHFPAGRAAAADRGVTLDWVQADAQALPFESGEFDVVTSSFGAIFAPDQEAVAREMARVCRPGGTLAMTAFTPEGIGGAFFGLVEPWAPGAVAPLEWGREERVRELFGDSLGQVRIDRRRYVERAASPEAYCRLFTETFGPMVALRAALSDPDRQAFDASFHEFAASKSSAAPGGGAEYWYEYLLVVGERSALAVS